MKIASLYSYPIKGLSSQARASAELRAGEYFPFDRRYALENGPSGFDPDRPEHQPKIKFLMLMRNAALAGLETHVDEESRRLTISRAGALLLAADLRSAADRAQVAAFLTDYLASEIRGPVRMLEAPSGFRFTDSKQGFVSFVNLASVAAISPDLDPLRFRANIYLEGAPAFAEMEFVGRSLVIGDARLDILKTTDRCAATGVAPGEGVRDRDVVAELRQRFGHIDCGVYGRVMVGGRIARGDAARLEAPAG